MNRQVLGILESLEARAGTVLCFLLATSNPLPAAGPPDGPLKPQVRIAIGGFAAISDPNPVMERSRRLADLLTTELARSPDFELVERAETERLAAEQALSLGGRVNPAENARLGRMLRADWFVVGSFLTLGGSNCVVVRVVDAPSGVIRDLACLAAGEADLSRTAHALTEFRLSSRQKVTASQRRTFLGVGGFEDARVNNRHPELRQSIRLRLEEAFRGTAVAVVERTMVAPLLEEMRLHAGGLTAPTPTAGPASPGFVLIDGNYRSLFEEGQKIELLLRVETSGEAPRVVRLKAAAGEELLARVLEAVRGAVPGQAASAAPAAPAAPVMQRSEALAHLNRGKESARPGDHVLANPSAATTGPPERGPGRITKRDRPMTSARFSCWACRSHPIQLSDLLAGRARLGRR